MKKIFFYSIIFATFVASSCKKPLTEEPLDFYTPENSYTNKAQFESALANSYLSIRSNFYAATDAYSNYDMLGLDVDLTHVESNASATKVQYFGWATMNSDNGFAGKWWPRLYALIAQSNTIIDRADASEAKWTSDAEKNAIVGEAKFLRAFAYRFLANMWGDVPLVLKETRVPKFDYTKSKQLEVYQQCKADLEFAVQYMPAIDQVKGGRAPREAAYHLLSEINICLKDYPAAITAATAVISGGKCNLMTSRFGLSTGFKFSGYDYRGAGLPWGDVYWDLFQEGNMNWKEGNKEAIWNVSQDPTIKGGDNIDVHAQGGFFVMDRWWGPIPWQAKDKNNVSNWLMDTLSGRPVASLIVSGYADSVIWKYKGNFSRDLRNSEYNIQRTYYFTNPASAYYGQAITKSNVDASTLALWEPRLTPHFKKFIRPVPVGLATDASSKRKNDNGRNWKDWYIMRLAETYLLRAEANMLKGDLTAAAADINAVRGRANATSVAEGDVNMDLILDERARELYGEEFRLNTLMRTGKLVEYLNKYNGYLKDNGLVAPARVAKLPIPRKEIEANKGAVLLNNEGY
ncbi:RagB/SusD family nutrient uptake outer membrane protein [Pedobacter nyackensis]|nr:RagB/SusD family nutrient uptake outer membrane protein [Pedobacter nyackensis]